MIHVHRIRASSWGLAPIAITDTADAAGGVDPDRASFTTAVQTARDLIAQAANVIAETTIDRIGTIGGHPLDNGEHREAPARPPGR